MLRSTLVAALSTRRDNDVRVNVPLESGGFVRLAVLGVSYDPSLDVLLIDTEQHYDLPYIEETP